MRIMVMRVKTKWTPMRMMIMTIDDDDDDDGDDDDDDQHHTIFIKIFLIRCPFLGKSATPGGKSWTKDWRVFNNAYFAHMAKKVMMSSHKQERNSTRKYSTNHLCPLTLRSILAKA